MDSAACALLQLYSWPGVTEAVLLQLMWTTCKLPLLAMAGALDTQASQVCLSPQHVLQAGTRLNPTRTQAVGAGQLHKLPAILQRCLLFLTLHGIPFSVLLALLPTIFRAIGEPATVAEYAAIYLPGVQVALWFDVLFRPLNR